MTQDNVETLRRAGFTPRQWRALQARPDVWWFVRVFPVRCLRWHRCDCYALSVAYVGLN